MLNLLVYLITWPFLKILSSFRPPAEGALVIHTARIGDYVNASVLFNREKNTSVLISRMNLPFAKRDDRIQSIFIFEEVRRGLSTRLGFALRLYWRNYKQVWVTTPSSLNALFGLFAFSPGAVIIHPYKTGLTARALMYFYPRTQPHTHKNLTIHTYLRMAGIEPDESSWKERIIIPCVDRKRIHPLLGGPNKIWRVGVGISAHNKSKLIPVDEWCWLFRFVISRGGRIVPIGLEEDRPYLKEILCSCPEVKPAMDDVLGLIPLSDLPDNLAVLDLAIGADSGPLFIADSVGTPVILFVGACNVTEQSPLGPDTLFIPPAGPVEKYICIFDTSYDVKAEHLYHTSETLRKSVEAHIDHIRKR